MILNQFVNLSELACAKAFRSRRGSLSVLALVVLGQRSFASSGFATRVAMVVVRLFQVHQRQDLGQVPQDARALREGRDAKSQLAGHGPVDSASPILDLGLIYKN